MPNGISLSCCATRGAARRKPSSPRTATISARARRSTSTRCSTTFDADALGTSRHPRRTRVSHLAVLSRLERAAIGACGRTCCCGRVRRAAPYPLDRDLHGRSREVPRAVLSALSARCPVRQADGRQRLGRSDREVRNGAGILAVALAGAIVTYGGVSLFRRLLRPRSHGAE